MESKNKCKMCNSSEPLKNSHILPRSYFRGLKKGSGQLYEVKSSADIEARLTNADPKEELLCSDCEQFLSINYEKYGTRLLKDTKVNPGKDTVTFKSFRYKEFYLYLISILWRASISNLERYEHIELGESINNLLCHCVRNNRLKIQTSLKLDHFFKISVIRLKDESQNLDDLTLRKVMFDMSVEFGEKPQDGILYYFSVDGFLITYHFSSEEDIHMVRTKRNFAQLLNRQNMTIPIRDISNFKQIVDGFNTIRSKSGEFRKSDT
ncbi:MAG: hypothetical protein KAT25_07470 [Sulfuriflexus sp.]|nr:hypothetical protein [Sulfuriflexus sp.]